MIPVVLTIPADRVNQIISSQNQIESNEAKSSTSIDLSSPNQFGLIQAAIIGLGMYRIANKRITFNLLIDYPLKPSISVFTFVLYLDIPQRAA